MSFSFIVGSRVWAALRTAPNGAAPGGVLVPGQTRRMNDWPPGELYNWIRERFPQLALAAGWIVGLKTVKDYGAKGDGTTSDDDALQRAVDDLPDNGGTLIFPPGRYTFNSPFPSLSGKRSVSLVGFGGLSAGDGTATSLTYTGSTAPFIDATESFGLRIADLFAVYTNGSFTGNLVDLGSPGSSSAHHTISRCAFEGDGTQSAAALVSMSGASSIVIDGCRFGDAVCAVKGRDSTDPSDYSNGILISGCAFNQAGGAATTEAPIQNPGQAWVVEGCVFEPLSDDSAGAILDNLDGCRGLTVTGCWMGDANSNGTWINYQGAGLVVESCEFEHGNIGVNLRDSSFGNAVKGNSFDTCITGIREGSNCRNNDLQPNFFTGCTTDIANTGSLEEQLWTLRGCVTAAGGVSSGLGWTVNKSATGTYDITFTVPFSAAPSPTATLGGALTPPADIRVQDAVGTGGMTVKTYNNAGLAADSLFFFNATGPR